MGAGWLNRTPEGYLHSRGRIYGVYAGLMAVMLIASLDQTVVATALPHVVADIGGLSSYSWAFTAFLLCQTIAVPIFGKLGDVHGRRPMLLWAVAIFLVASLACAIAQSMTELAVFRGLQGLAAGGLNPLVWATMADFVPPRDRGRYQGPISAVNASAAVAGPAIGGVIADHASWRWIFLINIPLCAAAFAVIALAMPKREGLLGVRSIDYAGALFLSTGVAAFLLALVWGGESYPWSSPEVLAAFAVAALMFVVLARSTSNAREPVLPFSLLRRAVVATAAAAIFLMSFCMYGALAFVPLFMQGAVGLSATSSGVVLTPFMLGAVAASFASGLRASHTGRYRANALAGAVVLTVGMTLLCTMSTATGAGRAALFMGISGVGIGLTMQVLIVAAQNSVASSIVGVTTALLQFARAIGATLGVALFGVVVNLGLSGTTARHAEALARRLSAAERSELAHATRPALVLAAGAAAFALLVVYRGLKEHPLRRAMDDLAPMEVEL